MAGPKIEIDADECQALLDLFEHFAERIFEQGILTAQMDPLRFKLEDLAETAEEKAALAKLRAGGKFYVPK